MRIRTMGDATSVLAKTGDCDVPHIGTFVLPVVGAGHIAVGQNTGSRCGAAVGVEIEVSWTKYGYSGGVMDRKDVAALRDYLTALLEGSVEQIDATGDPGSAAHLPG